MSDTPPPAKKAASKRAAKKATPPAKPPVKGRGGGTYVPALPAGWTLEITAQGPGGQTATVKTLIGADDNQAYIEFRWNGQVRDKRAPSMKEGCKELGKGAKRIAALVKEEERVRASRDETLAGLGELVREDRAPDPGED